MDYGFGGRGPYNVHGVVDVAVQSELGLHVFIAEDSRLFPLHVILLSFLSWSSYFAW